MSDSQGNSCIWIKYGCFNTFPLDVKKVKACCFHPPVVFWVSVSSSVKLQKGSFWTITVHCAQRGDGEEKKKKNLSFPSLALWRLQIGKSCCSLGFHISKPGAFWNSANLLPNSQTSTQYRRWKTADCCAVKPSNLLSIFSFWDLLAAVHCKWSKATFPCLRQA